MKKIFIAIALILLLVAFSGLYYFFYSKSDSRKMSSEIILPDNAHIIVDTYEGSDTQQVKEIAFWMTQLDLYQNQNNGLYPNDLNEVLQYLRSLAAPNVELQEVSDKLTKLTWPGGLPENIGDKFTYYVSEDKLSFAICYSDPTQPTLTCVVPE